MKKFYQIIIIALFSLPILLFESKKKEFDYEFIQKDTYINKAKKEAIKFLHEFKEYIERTCD